MISLNEIKQSYPEKSHTFPRALLREYLQYKILEIIFNSPYASKLSFLGGTALRICYSSTRFSEDIDFDNFNLSVDDFEKIAILIKKDLLLEGYIVEIRNIYKGAYRCQIKIPRLLFDNKLSGLEEEKILIQLDTMPHNYKYIPEIFGLNKFDVFTNIFITPKNLLLSEKIFAASERKRAKGRDFFDIIFLLRDTKPDYDYLKSKMKISNSKELITSFLKFCDGVDFKMIARDVAPFLINPREIERVTNFPQLFKEMLENEKNN